MDLQQVSQYTHAQLTRYRQLQMNGLGVLQALNHQEYVVIEDDKDAIFQSRLDFLCLSISLRETMQRESHYQKSFKRYFMNYLGMTEENAEVDAHKYNQACRTYDSLGVIFANCQKYPNVDIRDLSVKEMYLARNESWFLQRSASLKKADKPKPVPPAGEAIDIDPQALNQTVDDILGSSWYKDAKANPKLVARLLQDISTRVLNDSLR